MDFLWTGGTFRSSGRVVPPNFYCSEALYPSPQAHMQSIYPGDTRDALEVFCLYEAEGEYFDISDPSHVTRDSIGIAPFTL